MNNENSKDVQTGCFCPADGQRIDCAASVLEGIRTVATPTRGEEEEMGLTASEAYNRVNEQCMGKSGLNAMLCGSYPKGTWLAGEADIDVFIGFPPSVGRVEFTETSRDIGFRAMEGFGPYVRYSEHPFVEANMNGTKINIVPYYVVEDGKWKSAADRSAHHTTFMTANLTESMKADIRLLKMFLKGNGLYGSEISRNGFSGYSTEVLVWNLGSFEGVMRRFAEMCKNDVIGHATKEFATPITIMDPIDSQRNLAAAVSDDNMGRFILLCRRFLDRPSVSLFETRKAVPSYDVMEQCVTVSFQYSTRSPDKIGGQVKKAASAVATQLLCAGYGIIKSGGFTAGNTAGLFFLLDSTTLPRLRTRRGPSVHDRLACDAFVAKNRARSQMMWVDGGRILSTERNETGGAVSFVIDLLAGGVSRSGIPGGLVSDIQNGFTVQYGGDNLSGQALENLRSMVASDTVLF